MIGGSYAFARAVNGFDLRSNDESRVGSNPTGRNNQNGYLLLIIYKI
jgi:hypothetical protein